MDIFALQGDGVPVQVGTAAAGPTFHRESLDGLNLSTVVRADIVPVLPDRSLHAHQDGNGLHLQLDGLGRAGSQLDKVVAVLDDARPGRRRTGRADRTHRLPRYPPTAPLVG